jgi:UDP-glucuronate 4-epimerase
MKILVTGTAGFVGFHLVKRLAERGFNVVGLDNLNAYYDVQLKLDRLRETGIDPSVIEYKKPIVSDLYANYRFFQLNLEDTHAINHLFETEKFDIVCHLAAQAGVRYSIDNPQVYVESNILGFFNIIEGCRRHKIQHLVYASSSSVYGNSHNIPFTTDQKVDNPISLYAATKKSNELMAHTYSHLFQLPTTGLRFFTVYGPWGRPDMAYFSFTKAILQGKPIKVFNYGKVSRDFTYIDDIVEGVVRVIEKPFFAQYTEGSSNSEKSTTSESAFYRVYNIGNNQPVSVGTFIETIENALGKTAVKELLPMQAGDVETTFADVSGLERDFNYRPKTSLSVGIQAFVNWYKNYYKIATPQHKVF